MSESLRGFLVAYYKNQMHETQTSSAAVSSSYAEQKKVIFLPIFASTDNFRGKSFHSGFRQLSLITKSQPKIQLFQQVYGKLSVLEVERTDVVKQRKSKTFFRDKLPLVGQCRYRSKL